jgi:hypothetical protein
MASEPIPSRRRFQINLRTLLIGVTLLAVACGYVGWQAKIVRERRAALAELRVSPRRFTIALEHVQGFDDDGLDRTIPTARRWMGDQTVYRIVYKPDTTEQELSRLRRIFPEALIYEFKGPVKGIPLRSASNGPRP